MHLLQDGMHVVDQDGPDGLSPLMTAARYTSNSRTVKQLLSMGGDRATSMLTATDRQSRNALQHAIQAMQWHNVAALCQACKPWLSCHSL